MGVAAVGYALGRPQNSTTARPSSNKRKAIVRSHTEDLTSSSLNPRNSSWLPETTSTLGSRRQKPTSLRRPQSAIFPLSSVRQTTDGVVEGSLDDGMEWKRSSMLRQEASSAGQGQFAFDAEGARTARSSWLRRLSSFSSYSQPGSPTSTHRPESSSISFSNGSTAPILSNPPSTTTPILPRNKLVKRSSSLRVLHSNNAQSPSLPRSQVPPLRRPATSHQRSATLQQQFKEENNGPLHDPFQPLQDGEANDEAATLDDPPHDWRPFFRARTTRLAKEGSSKKRNAAGNSNRHDSIRSISPVPDDVPTLLVATAIKDMTLDEASCHGAATPNRSSQISTGFGFSSPVPFPSAVDSNNNELDLSLEQKARSSFSISDMFSSSSPSAWKTARSGSLRSKKGPVNSSHGRRVASAPQPSKNRRSIVTKGPVSSNSQAKDGTLGMGRCDPDSAAAGNITRTPSSPLPSLSRLSAFEIDLPEEAPSYPTSPQPDAAYSPSGQRSSFGASLPSPIGPSARTKAQRPSRAPSDRASTLVGSENEYSRTFSGEREDAEYQSETAYDSVRTGATGSSHSGIRGPRIETIFDESPPRELRKTNLAALQDLLSNGSFVDSSPHGKVIAEVQESPRTPLELERSFDDDLPTPVGGFTQVSASSHLPSSPPLLSLALKRRSDDDYDMQDTELDEKWSFNDESEPPRDHNVVKVAQEPPHLMDSPDLEEFSTSLHDIPISRQSSTHEAGAKSHLFEWSERHVVDKESQQGSSPRPRTVHGKQGAEGRGSRTSGRRGPSALHLRSQSVPVNQDTSAHRGYNTTSKLDSWLLGNKGASEEWDGDFEFDEPSLPAERATSNDQDSRPGEPAGMLVPRAILERQASVHGQFGQVKELTLLVEELKRLRYQASVHGILRGQSSELWKEAEGIINLATLDDEEQEFLPPRSPHSPNFDLDPFEEDSPASQRHRRSGFSPPQDDLPTRHDIMLQNQTSSHSSPGALKLGASPSGRPRKESAAKAKSVLENISQHRSTADPPFVDTKTTQKKLPFDTTSLRDLVTRAGVVTRALKEIVRRAENAPLTPERRSGTPPDPPFSQIFQHPSSPPPLPKSSLGSNPTRDTSFSGVSISGNDTDINGHLKMMTVV